MWGILKYVSLYRRFFIFCILFFIGFLNFLDTNVRQNQIFLDSFKNQENSVLNLRTNIRLLIKSKEQNEILVDEVLKLREELINYKELLKDKLDLEALNNEYRFKLITSKVIKLTNRGDYNYIIIDKGFEDGIKPDMGVINDQGVLGIVEKVYKDYSIILTLFNKNVVINSKLKSNQCFGSLRWNGDNRQYLSLEDIPSYVDIKENDTIFTTGYSFIFPKDIPLGILKNKRVDVNSTFYSLDVYPIVNFYKLNYVYVIDNTYYNKLKIYNE